MTDHRKWKYKDSDFSTEELARTIESRLRWDAQVAQWQKEGFYEWNDFVPFDPLATEHLTEEVER